MDQNAIEQLARRIAEKLDAAPSISESGAETTGGVDIEIAAGIIASELRSAQAEAPTGMADVQIGPGSDNYGEGYLDNNPEAPAPDLDAIEETIKMNDWCACREYLAGTPHDCSLTVAPVETDELTLAIEEARKSCQCLYLAVEESIARDVQTKVNTVVGLLERRLRAGPAVRQMDAFEQGASARALQILAQENAELRARVEPTVGSWPWALEQMKAGKSLRRPEFLVGRSLCLSAEEPRTFVFNAPFSREWRPFADDFEATDWQLAESE